MRHGDGLYLAARLALLPAALRDVNNLSQCPHDFAQSSYNGVVGLTPSRKSVAALEFSPRKSAAKFGEVLVAYRSGWLQPGCRGWICERITPCLDWQRSY
jgi:hypothetical protein